MARATGSTFDFMWYSVSIEDELNSVEMTMDVDLQEVTAAADAAPEFVEGKANGSISIAGSADLAANQGDAKLFGAIGAGEQAFIWSPAGGAAGTNNPNYTGNAYVKTYRLRSSVKEALNYSATLQVNGAVNRGVGA